MHYHHSSCQFTNSEVRGWLVFLCATALAAHLVAASSIGTSEVCCRPFPSSPSPSGRRVERARAQMHPVASLDRYHVQNTMSPASEAKVGCRTHHSGVSPYARAYGSARCLRRERCCFLIPMLKRCFQKTLQSEPTTKTVG